MGDGLTPAVSECHLIIYGSNNRGILIKVKYSIDAGMIDAEGYISIMSRSDDLINTAGHRLSTGKETLHTKPTPPASPPVQILTQETYIYT